MTDAQLVGLLLVTYIFCIHPLIVYVLINALVFWWRNRVSTGSGKSIWAAIINPPDPTIKPKEL